MNDKDISEKKGTTKKIVFYDAPLTKVPKNRLRKSESENFVNMRFFNKDSFENYHSTMVSQKSS